MYFGHGAYGVQAAAQKYFGHNASQCNLDECALIIGLLQRPNAYSPFRNYDAAINRRNIVLRNMETVGYIDSTTSTVAQEDSIITKQRDSNEEFGIAPYFTEWVRQILQKKHGLSLYEDGFSVFTTLDSRIQACAEKAVREHLPEVQKRINRHFRQKNRYLQFLNPTDVERIGIKNIKNNTVFIDSVINANAAAQVAMVAIDPATGYIKAMVGGRNFEESKFNRVLQSRRQPGSAFKPIAFAAAIDNGYSPSTELLNQPVVLYMANGDVWRPENYGHSEGGPTTLREGLRKSYNLVAARLVQELVPPQQVVDFAHKIGIKSHLDAVDAISLGATGLTPIELTSAYCVFDNQGIATTPMPIIRVLDKYGSVLEENFPSYREAMREEVAYVMTNMMQTVIDHGTGIGVRSRFQFLRPAAGKTGTTNDYTDAWFVGYTPQLVCAVWVGLDDPQFSLGTGQEGARVALPIWAPFMKTAHDTMLATTVDTTVWERKKFVMPMGVVEVEICNETKKLATEACPHIVKEIFIRENAPTEYCDKHTSFIRPNSQRRHY
ncbi:transglycosylase domain-containing protein, partial [bacterium]|nr:transglycosylase domain-containing protein [bacterium]